MEKRGRPKIYTKEEALYRKRECDRKYQARKRKINIGYKTEEFRKWRGKNPEKYKAQQIVNTQIKLGKIERSFCKVCGKTCNIQAHHPDYSKPLKIIWLCPIHHKQEHNN
jgi:hypothetical protein